MGVWIHSKDIIISSFLYESGAQKSIPHFSDRIKGLKTCLQGARLSSSKWQGYLLTYDCIKYRFFQI